jgi:pilus assembly protein CpaB
MRARPALLLLVAVAIAGGTAMLANSWLKAQRIREIARAAAGVTAPPARSVLVARTAIRRGEILRPYDLVWQAWPAGDIDKAYLVEGGSRKPDGFAGWVAINPFAKGEPITLEKIIAPGDRGFLAAVLQPGMRAISVPVTVTSGVSGFVFPGDRVDLLLTYAVPPRGDAEKDRTRPYEHRATATVLRNLRVIAIDQKLQAKPGEAVVAHTATFEVTPKQAEGIALSSEIGKLSLSLHSLVADPSAASGDSPIASAATYTLDTEITPLLPKANGGSGPPQTLPVTILHGLSEKQINFPLRSALLAARGQ